MSLPNVAAVEHAAVEAVNAVPITDIHTHLFPPSHGGMLLWGVDELLTYHYLIAELFTVAPKGLTLEAFWKLAKPEQAGLVWEHVFLRHGPISEAARGVLTCLNALGLDVAGRKLAPLRKWFAQQKVDAYLEKVFQIAGLDYAVMTNNPFEADEAGYLTANLPCPDRLKTALRIDNLLLDWPAAAKTMRSQGYKTAAKGDAKSCAAAVKFLADWAKRIRPMYMAASLSSDFAYPSRGAGAILDKVVIPAARQTGLPVALMIGVRRQVNPALRTGGDGVGEADVSAVGRLCQKYPDVKFLVTLLSRVNQHELCVLARKFGTNLHLFGCWWFCNNPSIIEEMTRMRMELLGTAVTLQHSDARVLDQLLYKWKHSRAVVGKVLAEKYRDLYVAGWRPAEEEIRRDARAMLGGSFESFIKK